MRMGLTVAQVYQQIAAKLTTDTTATTLKAGGDSYSVVIVDKTDTPTLDDIFNMEFETTTTDENGSSVKETHTLGEFATRTTTAGYTTIARENGSRKLAVTSETADGYNTTLLSRELEPQLAALDLPDGVTAELAGETTQVTEMLSQMAKMLHWHWLLSICHGGAVPEPAVAVHCSVHDPAGLHRRYARPDGCR